MIITLAMSSSAALLMFRQQRLPAVYTSYHQVTHKCLSRVLNVLADHMD